MPSKNMLPKGKRRHSVRKDYRAARDAAGVEKAAAQEAALEAEFGRRVEPVAAVETGAVEEPVTQHAELPPIPVLDLDDETEFEDGVRSFAADAAGAGRRLDAYLAQALPEISRARVQLLIEAGQVKVNGAVAKASLRLAGGERIEIEGEPRPEPLHAIPEDIPLEILYEDQYLAVVNKPAGMMVHAGAGATDDARNRGTLVNAILFHFASLSTAAGEIRPGIVHRLDRQTSGALVVAKDDVTHRRLSEMFHDRELTKRYVALVHGRMAQDAVTITLPIGRDLVRRIRMTTRRSPNDPATRSAVSHVLVTERLDTPYGPFTLVEVEIETGRTHQIRVHLQSLGHAVVGDTLYGAPAVIKPVGGHGEPLLLSRNFLHAAHLDFKHPRTDAEVVVDAPLPVELQEFLKRLRF